MRKIGVFDSGVGGLSVANAIADALPKIKVIYENDAKNIPYGTKTEKQLYSLVLPILKKMQNIGCENIVIACNTVSTTILSRLKKEINIPLIGVEPMVEQAAEVTVAKKIAVFATPTTLKSARYGLLKKVYAKNITVLEPDCSDWSYMIEQNKVDRSKIIAITNKSCVSGADVIVLGCTHYHWIEELIRNAAANRAKILQPEGKIINNLKASLSQML